MRQRLIGVILIIAFTSACAARRPEVHLADLRIGEMRPFETELLVLVRVQNDTNRPLNLQGASYRLYINDTYIGKGVSGERLTVPPFGSALHPATLQLSNLSLLPTIQKLLSARDFSYELEGRLYEGSLFGDTPVSDSGRFEFPR